MSIELFNVKERIGHLFCDSLKEKINENDIDKVIDFLEKISEKENNCFEFISSIFVEKYNNEEYIGITIFIQPIGHITLYGDCFDNTLKGWEDILLKQPCTMHYKEAGSFIKNRNKSFLRNKQINIINENTNLENYWAY